MRKYEDENTLNNFIRERIEENSKLFTKEDLIKIKNNFAIAKKLYLLGFFNMKNVINNGIDK